MTKEHFLSFLMDVSDQGNQFVRLYPEGNAEARFKINGVKTLYAYCSRHEMFQYGIRGRMKGKVQAWGRNGVICPSDDDAGFR